MHYQILHEYVYIFFHLTVSYEVYCFVIYLQYTLFLQIKMAILWNDAQLNREFLLSISCIYRKKKQSQNKENKQDDNNMAHFDLDVSIMGFSNKTWKLRNGMGSRKTIQWHLQINSSRQMEKIEGVVIWRRNI